MAADDFPGFKLPTAGTLYYDYLDSFPVGCSMHVEMYATDDHPPFNVTKMAAGQWAGVPDHGDFNGLVSTRALFDFVKLARPPGDEVIMVTHGSDPRKVKSEHVELCEEEETTKFCSLSGVIEINSDDELDLGAVADAELQQKLRNKHGRTTFERVRCARRPKPSLRCLFQHDPRSFSPTVHVLADISEPRRAF